MADRLVWDGVKNRGFPFYEDSDVVVNPFSPPYPERMLSWDGTVNAGLPYFSGSDVCRQIFAPPYPTGILVWDGTNNGGLPYYAASDPAKSGSFCRAADLVYVSIPMATKFIGDHAFTHSSLPIAIISPDANVGKESFPASCDLEWYDTGYTFCDMDGKFLVTANGDLYNTEEG